MDKEADLKGRLIAQAMWSELEKIAQNTQGQEQGLTMETEQQPLDEGEEAPAHSIVGVNVDLLDKKRAKGYPIIQPPPGFVFVPDLQSFIPDPNQPGWMSAQEAMEAARNKSYYDAGQQDVVAQQAQQTMDSQVEQESAMAQEEAAQQEEMAAQQQAMASRAEQNAMNLAARKAKLGPDKMPGTGDEMVAAPSAPAEIVGSPQEPKPKQVRRTPGSRKIRIDIGR